MRLFLNLASTQAHWPAQGNKNDTSGNSLTLSVDHGSEAYVSIDACEQAWTFGGAVDYIENSGSSLLRFGGEFTAAFIFESGATTVETIFQSDPLLYSFYINTAGNFTYADQHVNATPLNGSLAAISASGYGAAVHCFHVRRRQTSPGVYLVELFIDGVNLASIATVTNTPAGTEKLRIGGFSSGANLKGKAGDFRFDNVAISDAQVAADFAWVFGSCISTPTAVVDSPAAGSVDNLTELLFEVTASAGFSTATGEITDSVVTDDVAWSLAGGFEAGYYGTVDTITNGYRIHLSRTGGWRSGSLELDVAVLDLASQTATATRTWTEVITPPPTRTTASYITGQALHDPFYYLKITGLPYYFFSIIDPTDAKWGTAQWTLPTGYTSVKGMDVPADQFVQTLNDIIGGIATAERVTFQMMDFNVVDANGPHSFFGRLLSPGRTAGSASAIVGFLSTDLPATQTSGTFNVRANGGAFTAVDTFIGGETIGVSMVSGPDANSDYTLTIGSRNKYPCTSTYPSRPYYTLGYDSVGNVDPDTNVLISQVDPIMFIGRSAALYIGHMTPDGRPEPESTALLRFVGHVRGVGYGRDPGKFSFDIESVIADIGNALVAPALAHATLAPVLYVPTSQWQTLQVYVNTISATGVADTSTVSFTVQLAAYDTIQSLIADLTQRFIEYGPIVTPSFSASVAMNCAIVTNDAQVVITADCYMQTSGTVCMVSLGWADPTTNPEPIGVLSALGFTPGYSSTQLLTLSTTASDGHTDQLLVFTADRGAPSTFVPTLAVPGGVDILLASGGDAIGDRFFSNQGDGSDLGYVRWGDGQVGTVLSHSGTSITVGARILEPFGGFNVPSVDPDTYYYVESPNVGTVDQILHIPGTIHGTAETALFQLLASDGNFNDGEFNVFPQGCGLALSGILDKATLRTMTFIFTTGFAIDVDATVMFSDLWTGISKLLGLFLVWDPATALITVRQLLVSNSAFASTFALTESNRSSTGDRSVAIVDQSNLRTGWTIRSGWDFMQRKFLAPDLNINDNYALLTGQTAIRTETIEDRTIPASENATVQLDYANAIGKRAIFTRYPWMKITRSVNKTGFLLSPGLYCQIVDDTIFNPFTGILGIAASDGIYGFLTSVKSTLIDGEVSVDFIMDQTNDPSLYRPLSPTALLKFGAANNGYSTTTGIVTLDTHYAQNGAFDGIDFIVGDKVVLTTRSNNGAPGYLKTGTVSAVATDGSTVTIDSGLGAVSTAAETIMILQDFSGQTTARIATPGTRVSFQGDGNTLLISGSLRLEKWS